MADEQCITPGIKSTILTLLRNDADIILLTSLIEQIPHCPSGGVASGGVSPEKKARQRAELWPEANYYDKDGSVTTGALTALFKEKYGEAVTENDICRWWTTGGVAGDQVECRSPSTVENFLAKGNIVRGNGEPPPSQDPSMSFSQVEKAYKEWKDYLLKNGLKVHVYHPENPEIIAATKAVEQKATPKGRARK